LGDGPRITVTGLRHLRLGILSRSIPDKGPS